MTKSTWRTSPFPLLILLLAAVPVLAAPPPGMAPAAAAVAVPPVLKKAPELARLLRDWDEQSVLAMEVARQAPRQVLNRAAMQRTRIETAGGDKVALDKLFDSTFTAQRALDKQMRRIPATALVGRPQINEAVVEFPDRLLMVRQVRVVVRDPQQAAAAAPELARFLAPVDQAAAAQARVADLAPDVQQSFRRYITAELPLLDADDPLRQALAAGGEDAVLRAVLSGVGEFDVTEQVAVERRLYNDGVPRLTGEFHALAQTVGPVLKPTVARRSAAAREPASLGGPAMQGRDYHYPAGERHEGRLEFSEPFLAGFTLGQELAWERKWKFGAGFLRVNYGMGYGFGLRIPVALNGRLEPTRSVRSSIDDPGRDLTLRLQAVTSDAQEEYYSRVGLAPGQVFGGDEFVFTAGSWFGFKLYALGKTWAELTPVNSPWHKSRSFRPPLGGSPREIFTFAVPPELTNTAIELGALSGALEVGLGLNGSGKVLVPYALLVDGRPAVEQRITLNNANQHTETLRLPPLTATPGTVVQQGYGLRLGAPTYLMDVSAATRLRVVMRVRAGPVKRDVATDWIDVFTLPLGQIALPPHAGTHGRYEWNEGVRIFEARDPADPAAMQAPRTVPRPGAGTPSSAPAPATPARPAATVRPSAVPAERPQATTDRDKASSVGYGADPGEETQERPTPLHTQPAPIRQPAPGR
ncbi:hypothetical protein [Sulfurivermis fontis]|uniref:hypothetical protein n=1 Tax=Sulfurivermis fontis TaxID=1972068 RepID=UPI000FD900CD|nr:hypothetical protein [Sulfurivermis fontis]